MRKHLSYLRYVFRHKWYTFLACRELGITWLGIIHDWSKFRWSEWKPYADYFHGDKGDANRAAAKDAYVPPTKAAFDYAWLLHQKRNKHHWQYWILVQDEDPKIMLPMPEKYAKEMLADWVGAGRAISGRLDWRPWYKEHRDKIYLAPETRKWIEYKLISG